MAEGTLSNLKNKIMNSIENLVSLEIITAVGQVNVKSDDTVDKKLNVDCGPNTKAIFTKIDMLQGDISTVYDEEFVSGDYQALKQFHALREKEGHEIVRQNIENLKSLLKMIRDNEGAE